MDSRDIRILNFSNSGHCRKTSAYFRLKCASFCYLIVEVHPSGTRNKEYVSVRILKLSKNATVWSDVSNFHLSWTLSVVDVNGDARFCQSFVIEDAVQFTHEDILDFQKRSRLLSLADELLPEDVLTVRIELHEIYIGADGLVPQTKQERPIDIMSQLVILDSDTARKRGKDRMAAEIYKIYSSLMSLNIEMSSMDGRQEEVRTMLASYDALDEIRQTYLSSFPFFSVYLDIKETFRRILNDDKECAIRNLLRGFPLESNSLWPQLAPEPPKDEVNCSFETARHEDVEIERTAEIDQPLNREKKLNTIVKNSFGGYLKLMNSFIEGLFDKNNTNLYDEKEWAREALRHDMALSQKNEESERATENVQPLDSDISSFRDDLKESFKDVFGIMKHFVEERNFDTRHENDSGEKGYETEAMNSGPSHDEFQFSPGTVGQEGSLSRQDEESERRTETYQPSDLYILNMLIKGMESGQQLFAEVETRFENTDCEGTTQIGSILPKDIVNYARHHKQGCKDFLDILKAVNTCLVSESSLNSQNGECQRSMQSGQFSVITMGMSLNENEPMERLLINCTKPLENFFPNYNGYEGHDSIAENQATWNLYLETMDGIEFTIPFEDGRETLGSKLVSRSKVFQDMFELNPQRQTPEEKIKLKDEDCATFINFLTFLQTEEIEVETFPELIRLYIFADKYDVQELMLLCAYRMQPHFSPSNIDEVEEFACIHYDENLLELVQLYKEKNIQPVSELDEDSEPLLDGNSAAFNEKRNESHRDFDFYM